MTISFKLQHVLVSFIETNAHQPTLAPLAVPFLATLSVPHVSVTNLNRQTGSGCAMPVGGGGGALLR